MEQDQRNKKRAREDDEGENEIGSSFENNNNNNNEKRRDVHGISFKKGEEEEVEENGFSKAWDSSHLAVFDFPWLKDGGVMPNSEDWFLDFEDNFLQSNTSSKKNHGGVDIFEECGLCDIPEASTSHVQEDVWKPFEGNGLELEAEDLDCIWSSLLNKPI